MARSRLDIDDCPRTKVFRCIDRIIRTDPTLRRVFGDKILSWTGDANRDGKPLDPQAGPCLRITPGPAEDAWYSPEMQFGDLVMDVEIVLRGTLIDDLMNVWWAVQRAVYPVTGAQPNANLLNAAGATTGMITFLEPAFDRSTAENGYLYAIGRMKVEIREILNP